MHRFRVTSWTWEWSSWSVSWRRPRTKLREPRPPNGSCSASWTTPRSPPSPWTERSPPWRTSSGEQKPQGSSSDLQKPAGPELLMGVSVPLRRGDLPFPMRRAVSRNNPAVESDEEGEPKAETPEPKPEWAAGGLGSWTDGPKPTTRIHLCTHTFTATQTTGKSDNHLNVWVILLFPLLLFSFSGKSRLENDIFIRKIFTNNSPDLGSIFLIDEDKRRV